MTDSRSSSSSHPLPSMSSSPTTARQIRHGSPISPTTTTTTSSAVQFRNVFADNALESIIPPTRQFDTSPSKFRSNTIAPSPPLVEESTTSHSETAPFPIYSQSPVTMAAGSYSSSFSSSSRALDSASAPPHVSHRRESLSASNAVMPSRQSSLALQRKPSAASLFPSRTPSLKGLGRANSIGPASAASSVAPSPIISAMGDVTPLPSPLLINDSPGPWARMKMRLNSSERLPPLLPDALVDTSHTNNNNNNSTEATDLFVAALTKATRRKVYGDLPTVPDSDTITGNSSSRNSSPSGGEIKHGRNRSISDYHPDHLIAPKRHHTVSRGHHSKRNETHEGLEPQPHIRRELNYAESRGITSTVAKPPTPPPSDSSRTSTDVTTTPALPPPPPPPAQPPVATTKPSASSHQQASHEFFEAVDRKDGKRRRWRSVCFLGQGTFSRVMLATSQMEPSVVAGSDALLPSSSSSSSSSSSCSDEKPDRKTLVAVKVCEHGPRGGASEERVEMSLKRELEIMRGINHPSLVHLKAWSIEPTRAILVLSYCPGGDMFDVATAHREILTPPLLRRMFAELVGAVDYLHERRIVHRDIKLENVLVNLSATELADKSIDWTTYPNSVVTLTDLGLSRRIADNEKLETRCGSEDYAAPEVIMGQPYDGRATDAWSLGVLLYALLEARLPFDPHPNMTDGHRMRSRTSHRIARVEWRWVEYAGNDTDHDGSEAKFRERGLLGALEITEGLLKRARSRWTLDRVKGADWVKQAILVDGGLRFREEEAGKEVA